MADRMSWLRGLRAFRRVPSWDAAGFVLIPVLAALVTWVSGFVLPYRSSDGVISQYGLPLFWKTHSEYVGGVGFMVPVRALSTTTYSMDVFVLDLLLYAGIGYSVMLWRRIRLSLFTGIVTPMSSAWLAYATVFLSRSSQFGTWSGLPVPWVGFLYDGLFYNWIGFAIDVAFIAGLEFFAIFLYRGFRVIAIPGRTPKLS